MKVVLVWGIDEGVAVEDDPAWQAVRAVALNIGIELATAFAIIATWAVAVYLTRP